MDTGPECELHTADVQLVGGGTGVRNGPGQSVQFRDDQSVAFTHRCKRLCKPWAFAVGPGKTMIGLDVIIRDAEGNQRGTLF